MRNTILTSLIVVTLLSVSYCYFTKPVNNIAVKTQARIRVIAHFDRCLVDANTMIAHRENIHSDRIRSLLAQFSVTELRAVFKNRYDERGVLKSMSSEIDSSNIEGWREIFLGDKSKASEFAILLKKEAGVLDAYVEQPLLFNPCAVTNDPEYGNQWHLNSASSPYADIRAEQAWSINKGRNDVIIAVCDGGVDYTHRDLDPGDRSRVIAGYDSGDDDSDPMDNLPDGPEGSYAGHGTHIAGIIGAIANNGKDGSGIMWNCKIMPVKMVGNGSLTVRYVFGAKNWDFSTTAFPSDVADAIDYAVNNGAHIINLSYGFSAMGFPLNDVILKMPLLYNTISNAYKHNVVVVAAMGNEYEKGNPTEYPAGFVHEVIAVGNTDIYLKKSTSSNTGLHICVSAPGTYILSTQRGGGTVVKSGTSMAAPVVSGVAGLIISQGLDRGFNLTNDDVRHILERTADDIKEYGIGFDNETGYGKVNAYRALALLSAPNVLYHGISNGGTAVKTNLGKWIYVGGGRWGLASGMYLDVDRYVVTKHVNFDIPFCSTPTVWLRERESACMSMGNPNDGFPYAEITNTTNTGFDLKYSIYYVRYNSINQAINKWVPAEVNSAKIAYTVVGQPNLPATAGPIIGPTTVCISGATYTVSNLPAGCTVSWSGSSNLTLSSASGNSATFVANGSGAGWVRATLTGFCGAVAISKTVSVGKPAPPVVTGSASILCNAELYVEESGRSVTWAVAGPLRLVGGNSGYKCTVEGTRNGIGWVYATASNACGSYRGELKVEVTCESYAVYPNPTTFEVTISPLSAKSVGRGTARDRVIKSVRVVDKLGATFCFQAYGSETMESVINVSGFPTGVYILTINEGCDDEESHTIVKQ